MVEISSLAQPSPAGYKPGLADDGEFSPLDWALTFELCGATLRRFNRLPRMLQLLLEVRDLRPRSGVLFSVLSELYSNALGHGVLGLDSAGKCDAAGFGHYYQERDRRLAQLDSGFTRLYLQVAAVGPGGRLKIRVEDSGAGFDSRAVLARAPVTSGLCGRGLRLVRELSDCSHWSMDGRTACVEFVWGGPPDS